MADEKTNAPAGGGDAPPPPPKKKQDAPSGGLPMWMATYSDMVTLLLTFFILLFSFSKTETAKSNAAMGSIRNAFGGNVLVFGKVIQLGRSPDDALSMVDSQQPIMPFPIEFLTMEGLLDKYEVNRESDSDMDQIKSDLREHGISSNVNLDEMPQTIKVRVKDKIYFKVGSVEIEDLSIEVLEKLIKFLQKKSWYVFVIGYSSLGERSLDGSKDAQALSAARALAVAKTLIRRGIDPSKISTLFYGDSRPLKKELPADRHAVLSRRVEFLITPRDLEAEGHKVIVE